MEWVLHGIKERTLVSPSQEPIFLVQSPPPPLSYSESSSFNLSNRVSPSVLLIIIILAIIFFISGLLHLLVRLLFSPPNRARDEFDSATALQGQLQQLFNLHDAGVDQSFIDTLPVFNYKEIIGVKDPFDCAVCLCEFEGEDKLRLLPKCSHAFHMDCIDTWLLSHSTCPLCRRCLLNDFYEIGNFSPRFPVLDSGSQNVRQNDSDRDVARVNSHLSAHCVDQDSRLTPGDLEQQSVEITEKDDENHRVIVSSGEKVVSVKLGKFSNVDNGGEGSTSETNADARRCFSMGSFAYVMDENSSLQVPIRTPMKKQSSKKTSLPLQQGCRAAMSECGFDSRREFNGVEAFKFLEIQSVGNGNESKSTGGSFSMSKIWSRGKKDEATTMESSSRRAFSFRFQVSRDRTDADELKSQHDEETETYSFNSLDSQPNPASFTRRTLLWLMGRENKFVHSSFSSNV